MQPFPFFLFSMALCFLLCPTVRVLALRLGAVDHPGGRHLHDSPTPRLGGLALAGSMLTSLILCPDALHDRELLLALVLGGAVILLLGIRDDTVGMTALSKLALQLTAALFAVFCGVRFDKSGILSVPLTLLWLLLITNAFNLIDGLDGLCAGDGGIASGGIALLGLLMGDGTVSAVGSALLGGCIGFLPHNLRQKKLFLGDTGAQLLGFCIGLLSVRVINGGYALPALCIVAYPLTETVTTVLRRLGRGQSPLTADRGHFHHRLTDHGLSHRIAATVLLLPSLFCAIVGVLLPISSEAAGWVTLPALACLVILLDTEGIRKRRREDIPQDSR